MAKASIRQLFAPEIDHDISQLIENLTKEMSHLSLSPKPRVDLFALPQEILDIIFDLAYPKIDGFKAFTKSL